MDRNFVFLATPKGAAMSAFFSHLSLNSIGITIAAVGVIVGTITAEAISGILVAAGGVAIVGYGLWSAGRDKVVKDALRRESEAYAQLESLRDRLEESEIERTKLAVKCAGLEANHEKNGA